jgi:hypothetical protein
LKPVTDSQDKLVGLQEFSHGFVELSAKLARKDHARAEVIPVAETAGHAQDLELAESRRIFEQAKQVNSFGRGPGQLEGMSGFNVAVGPWGTKNADSRHSHDVQL